MLFFRHMRVCNGVIESTAMQKADIHYQIQAWHPAAHLFRVILSLRDPDPAGQVFRLPAWIPGSYMIRDFAKDVVYFSAAAGGFPIGWNKLDKSSWQIDPCKGPVEIECHIYAWDMSVRTAYLDQSRGFFNGTSVFLEAVGQSSGRHTVEILPPAGEVWGRWQLATTLQRISGNENHDFGVFEAQDYDELIDHPVEMAELEIGSFEVSGVKHELVLSGRHKADVARISGDLKKICQWQVDFFGGEFPDREYQFLTYASADGYGGLEHRASTALICKRTDLPQAHHDRNNISDDYLNFLTLCSHEYFHTWNIKRMKPAVFLPYHMEKESYTQLLWVFEGFTVYYEALALVRCGLIDEERYLRYLAETLTRVTVSRGRHNQSVAESSFDAWTRFYKQGENAQNAIVSYYSKGAMVALALDLYIRLQTESRFSLDDVVQAMWHEFGLAGKGLAEGDFEKLAIRVTGLALDDFFKAYVHGTEDPPLKELFSEFAVDYHLRPAASMDDKGGVASAGNDVPLSGMKIIPDGQQMARVQRVWSESPAEKAGLSAGDTLVALDGLRVTAGNFDKCYADLLPGSKAEIHFFRRDEMRHASMEVQAGDSDRVEITINEMNDAARQKRHDWLGIEAKELS